MEFKKKEGLPFVGSEYECEFERTSDCYRSDKYRSKNESIALTSCRESVHYEVSSLSLLRRKDESQ
jgi:hypothetical protein